jgi:hypothetical protein
MTLIQPGGYAEGARFHLPWNSQKVEKTMTTKEKINSSAIASPPARQT